MRDWIMMGIGIVSVYICDTILYLLADVQCRFIARLARVKGDDAAAFWRFMAEDGRRHCRRCEQHVDPKRSEGRVN